MIRADLDSGAERTWAATAVLLLQATLPYLSDEVDTWTECERLLPHVLAVADNGRSLGVEPEARLWLLHQAAVYVWSRGHYQQALLLQEQALDGRRQALGDDHPDTLRSVNHLAEIRRNLGDLHDARQLFEQVLAARRRVLGDDHPHTLWSTNSIAEYRRALGDLHGARHLLEQTLATQRRMLGDDHPDT